MLQAALLAHEQAGGIRFEMENAGKQHPDAAAPRMVVPTGKWTDWPRATLEARLLLNERHSVADVVFDWLGEDSRNPWDRAAEQGMIMLVLRGIAAVNSRWRGRSYLFAGDARALLSQVSPQPVGELLARCRENRPNLWRLLDAEIQEAIRRRTLKSDSQHLSIPGKAKPLRIVTAFWDSHMSSGRITNGVSCWRSLASRWRSWTAGSHMRTLFSHSPR
jgi:hypothetical protein